MGGESPANKHFLATRDQHADSRLNSRHVNWIANANSTARQHIGTDAASADERPQNRLPRELREMLARVAAAGSSRDDIADPEDLTNQIRQFDSARRQIASGFSGRELDPPVGQRG